MQEVLGKGAFNNGSWRPSFLGDLLWSSCATSKYQKASDESLPAMEVAPSWSWLSVRGPVLFFGDFYQTVLDQEVEAKERGRRYVEFLGVTNTEGTDRLVFSKTDVVSARIRGRLTPVAWKPNQHGTAQLIEVLDSRTTKDGIPRSKLLVSRAGTGALTELEPAGFVDLDNRDDIPEAGVLNMLALPFLNSEFEDSTIIVLGLLLLETSDDTRLRRYRRCGVFLITRDEEDAPLDRSRRAADKMLSAPMQVLEIT